MRLLLAVASAAVLTLPLTASAQLELTRNVRNTNVTVNTGSVAVTAYYAEGFVEPAGALKMQFNMFSKPLQQIFCVDFNNAYWDGANYNANVTLLSSSAADIGLLTRQGQALGGGNAFAKYLQMAWLADNFGSAPKAEWAGIQGAIWNIGSGKPSSALNTNVLAWLNKVSAADLSTVSRNGWAIVTDVNVARGKGGVQEFLVRTTGPAAVVPEPSTYALMATGLIGLAMLSRRRRAV